MKKIIIFICAVFVLQQAEAQKWRLGLKGGISIPNLRAPDNGSFSSGYKSVLGPQFGVIAERKISSLFSIQAEFNYSTQGGRKEGPQRIRTKDIKAYLPGSFTIPDSIPYIYATFNNQIDLVYLELPVMAKFSFKISDNSRIALYAGPYVGYLIKGKGRGEGQSPIFTDAAHTRYLKYNNQDISIPVDFTREEDIIDRLHRTNYGIQGGGSIDYSFSRYTVFFAGGGGYGMANLQKDENFGQNKTGCVTISIGGTINL